MTAVTAPARVRSIHGLGHTLRVGWLRGVIEIKEFFRQIESVVFTMALPIILLLVFGSIFSYKIDNTNVEFAEYFVPGILASALIGGICYGLGFHTYSPFRATPLLLIVIFSGYENFVSQFDVGDLADRPAWMGKVDFSALKLKLVSSIVAISAIALLRAFMKIGSEPLNETELSWLILVHLTFVTSGVLLALMDFLASRSTRH